MLQTKALYNLLKLNATEDPSIPAEAWALEDLRQLPLEELLLRLEKNQVRLNKAAFLKFAEQCDTPEELADLLLPDTASEASRDPFYLVVFELWRRLLPEKPSLSIFCDELDGQIALYDRGDLNSDELIQDYLAHLLEVLDEHVEAGSEPEEIFTAICDFCAHDLEAFLFDYIVDLLDSGNSLYASELIEGFAPYVEGALWLDFLKARLLSFTDMEKANLAIHRLLENELELPLLQEVLRSLAASGDAELFVYGVKKALPLLTDREEFEELLSVVSEYYSRLDEEHKEQAVQKLMKPGAPLHASDLKALVALLS